MQMVKGSKPTPFIEYIKSKTNPIMAVPFNQISSFLHLNSPLFTFLLLLLLSLTGSNFNLISKRIPEFTPNKQATKKRERRNREENAKTI